MKWMNSRRRPLVLACLAASAALIASAVASAAPLAPAARAKTPQRIVSLSPSATESLFAVGAGKQVVAVDSYSTSPKEAPVTKLSGFSPNAEAIASYRPDLVVISNDMNHIVSQLGKLKIAVLVSPAPTNLDGAYGEIAKIGHATGHDAEAAKVVTKMKRQIASIVASTPKPAKALTVYHELDQTYYSVTSKTFIGQIYTLFGLQNIADKASGTGDYPQLSAEYIVASSPDLIVLADTVCCGQTPATVSARPGWASVGAVRTRSISAVNDSIASQWGPRIVSFVKAVAAAVRHHERSGTK